MKRVFFLLSNLLCNVFLYAMEMPLIEVKTFAYSAQGKRKVQEDEYIEKIIQCNDKTYMCTGTFDGHSGSDVARLAKEKFFLFFEEQLKEKKSVIECLQSACEQCEELTKQEEYEGSGSTVLATCFEKQSGELSLLWLGDSKAIINDGSTDIFTTTEHNCKNKNEKKRIKDNNGCIVKGKLNNVIELTRSLGDVFAKKRIPQLISIPECKILDLSNKSVFLIEATDGFWNSIQLEKDKKSYLSIVKKFYRNYFKDVHEDDEREENIAESLVQFALKQGSMDNITVIVKFFGSNVLFNPNVGLSDEDELSETERSSNENSISEDSAEKGDFIQLDVDSLINKLENLNFEKKVDSNQQEQETQKQPEQETQKQPEQETQKQPEQEIQKQLEQEIQKQLEQEIQKQPEQEIQKEQDNASQKNQESPKLVPSLNKNYKYFFAGFVGMMLVVLFVHYYYKHLNKNIRIYS